MKKIITKILLLLTTFSYLWISIVSNTYAADAEPIIVTVTEDIPGAECDEKKVEKDWKTTTTYDCKIKPWFGTIVAMMGKIIKYFTFIAALWGVLFIVYNWIMMSMGWMDQSLHDEAKKRIIQTLIWLLVLFLSWVILNVVAPWVYVA
jgi:hypothetical protein